MPGDQKADVGTCVPSTGALVGSTTAPATPAPLRDIRIRKPGIPWMMVVVMLVIGVTGGLVGVWTGTRQAGYFLCIGLPIPLFIMGSARIGDRAMRKRLQSAAQSGGNDPAPAMAEAISRRVFWPSRSTPLSEMAKQLVHMGRLGETVRLQWTGNFAPVQPLTVVFEPRLLDESDAAFLELEAATAPDASTGGSTSPPGPAAGDGSGELRRVQRNLKLRGGWAFMVMFAAFLLRSGWESYQRGAVTWEFLFWTAILFLFLLGPDRGLFSRQTQWLSAPGGVLVRKAVRRTTRSQLHLFDRRKGVLCASQHRKKQWLVVAADAEGCEQALVTDREAQFLLRAWLSPLEPPPADRLTDLT